MSVFRKNIRSSHLVIAAHFMAFVLLVSTCDFINRENKLSGIVHFSGQEFAGSESCMDCHRSIVESHISTPHFLTSAHAGPETVKGSFDSGQNVLVLNERLKVVMDKTPSGLFQRGLIDGTEINKKPMDIIIGSGRKGQTYLYWQDNALFQLPISYYSALDTWSNSPGYPTDQIIFNRSVPARCLECHSTYFKSEKTVRNVETFSRSQVMLGVDCERCHGPAADHVTFHRNHPDEKKAQHIINPERLTGQQKLDNCALCHSGIRENFLASFSYIVGDRLEDFSFPSYAADSAATLDVHGNQYGLLASSKCFRMSTMDCSSCHDVHVKETNQLGVFSARCMNCHEQGSANFCKQPEKPGLVLSNNCIDCHMPALPSRQVVLQFTDSARSTPFFVRTHLIGTYEAQIKSFLAKIDNTNSGENKQQ